MAPYPCPEPGNAAYAASRALFDALITRLSDPRMATRPEHAVEEFITGAGRDVLQQMLQDHLDARASAEPRLAEVPGADLVVRRRPEPGHPAAGHHARRGRGHPDRLPQSRDVQFAPCYQDQYDLAA